MTLALLIEATRGSNQSHVSHFGTPFAQSYQIGASPQSPNQQTFTKGSDLFYSSIILTSVVKSPVYLLKAQANTGTCQMRPIETVIANPAASPSNGASSYFPFGYGSIHILGWPLFRLGNYRVLTGKNAFQFIVFSFSDPGNCMIRINSIDIWYRSSQGTGEERLLTGGMIFDPTNQPGMYGKDGEFHQSVHGPGHDDRCC